MRFLLTLRWVPLSHLTGLIPFTVSQSVVYFKFIENSKADRHLRIGLLFKRLFQG
jgi:hypothetical protein